MRNTEVKGLELGKLEEQKGSQCDYRPVEVAEGHRREGGRDSGQAGVCEQQR